MKALCAQISGGAPIKRIVASVTPGGGKSLLPLIAAAGLPKWKICWIVPRAALQTQAEESFCDPVLRALTGYAGRGIRQSTNERDPARGYGGFVTTYSAISLDKGLLLEEFSRGPYILVLDESQHVHADAAVSAKLTELSTKASLLILMSGTLERHGKERISFLDYSTEILPPEEPGEDKIEIDKIDFVGAADCRTIFYGRAQALADQAIIPLKATYMDARAEWKRAEKTVKVESLKYLKGQKASRALFTALKTEYALELLDAAVADWVAWKAKHKGSKLLVVAGSQVEAKRMHEHLKAKYALQNGLAIQDEGPKALAAIKAFRRESLPALVTVGMAYEGLDVKEVTHLAVLTRIRSKPWLEQCLARATRFNPRAGAWSTQEAHAFVPDDQKMRAIIGLIEKEQAMVIKKKGEAPPEETGAGEARDLFGDLIAVGSGASGSRTALLSSLPAAPSAAAPLTPSELEAGVREEIEKTVRAFALRKRLTPHDVNAKLKARFKKSRLEMSLDELEKVRLFVRGNFK